MFDLDTWQEVGEALAGSPLRTLLSMAGVFWGTLLLVAMVGFSRGLEGAATRSVSGFANNTVSLWGGQRSMPWQGYAVGERILPSLDDLPHLARVSGVRWIAPRTQLGGWRGSVVVRAGDEASSFSVVGDVPDMARIENHLLVRGRHLDALDGRELRKVAVIGRQVSRQLYGDADPLGQILEVNGVAFQVVGEFRARRADDEADRAEQSVKIPIETLFHTWQQYSGVVSWISAVAEDDVDGDVVEAEMKRILKRLHHVHPEDPEAVRSFSAAREFGRMRAVFLGIRGVTWMVGGATLLSGAVGIGNVMLIAVRERTREIGLRRAIGARPVDIVVMILRETLVMTGVAGLSGLVVGSGLCALASFLLGPDNPSFGPPDVPPGAVLLAAALLLASGVLAGLLPAQRAAAIDPAEALRSE